MILLVGGVSSAGLNPLPLAPSAPLRHPPAPAEASPCRTSRPATSSARLRAWVRKISANGKKLTIHYAFPRPPEDGHGGVPTIRHPARRRPTHTDDVVVARPWFKPQNGKWEEPRLLTGVLPTAQDGSRLTFLPLVGLSPASAIKKSRPEGRLFYMAPLVGRISNFLGGGGV